ncbi:hypothetical protein JTE90_012829 [Oedothorax gibbosus]|uniref:Uncharacterized protein n=1 Tax=Oedothorax gibbosus TaxID=931172 RepID=A0AAV6W243_9ARAC|nr:hypothetical protein JTE90_012829 [Oedothorax gibbosus]
MAKAVADSKKLMGSDRAGGGIPFLSIPMIVIGHLYLFDCKVQPYIPIFLLVTGYFSIFAFLLQVGRKHCTEEDGTCDKAVQFWYYLVSLFLLAWCIVGSVWVYSVEKVEYEDTTSGEYCNKTLYLFTWWILTITWGVLAVLVALSCCVGCFAACLATAE